MSTKYVKIDPKVIPQFLRYLPWGQKICIVRVYIITYEYMCVHVCVLPMCACACVTESYL